jgi:hypothetical protein
METRIYQARDLDLQRIAQALVLEYQAEGFEAQQFGDSNQVVVQLKKENVLRSITGFDKALGISLQRSGDEMIVQVGALDWVDQIAVGAVGLILYPLLVTAAIGAVQQRNVVHDVLDSIDRLVRQQQPQVSLGTTPAKPEGWVSSGYLMERDNLAEPLTIHWAISRGLVNFPLLPMILAAVQGHRQKWEMAWNVSDRRQSWPLV